MTTASVVIKARAGRQSNLEELRELWRYRFLIKVLVQRDLQLRYKNSVLGIGWSMAAPISQVIVLTIAIHYIMGAGPANMSAFILCAFLPWNFFLSSVMDASASVLGHVALLKKVYFPREIPVIATICSNFIHFLFSLAVFVVYRWGFTTLVNGSPGWPPIQILWLPAIVAVEFMFILGLSFFVCAWNVFYEDIKFIVQVVMNFAFYLLPIIYFAENIVYAPKLARYHPNLLYHLYLVNPLAWVVTAFRQVFFQKQIISAPGHAVVYSALFDWRYFVISAVISAVICVWGYSFYNGQKWKFTERS